MTALDSRYPIGSIQAMTTRDRAGLEAVAASMQQVVSDWRALLISLPAADLNRTYRPGSWTVQQLAHHTADGHLHGLNRLRFGLTSEDYVIQRFAQDAWLHLPDAQLPVADALHLLEAVNTRWVALLRGVELGQFDRRVTHPAEGNQDLWQLIAKHDWHLRHHLAHARLAVGQTLP